MYEQCIKIYLIKLTNNTNSIVTYAIKDLNYSNIVFCINIFSFCLIFIYEMGGYMYVNIN